jgi:taurine dioxygenase
MAQLKIRNLSPALGAEIEGFDLQAEIDEETWHELSRIFDDRGVLVFRGAEIDEAMQHRIVEHLHASGHAGESETSVNAPHGYISNREPDAAAPYGRLMFHCDMMWSEYAQMVLSLSALEAEQPSTPTLFVSSTYAWETLPDDLRARVEGLHARHRSGHQGRGDTDYEDELIQPEWDQLRDTVTPVAMAHPRTGQTMLYVCEQQTREIVELPKAESDELLDALFAHLYQPELQVAHDWQTGDLVVWDNQAIQHGRPYVPGQGPTRTLRKIHAPAELLQRAGAPAPTYERQP